jgi:hypothetical protein
MGSIGHTPRDVNRDVCAFVGGVLQPLAQLTFTATRLANYKEQTIIVSKSACLDDSAQSLLIDKWIGEHLLAEVDPDPAKLSMRVEEQRPGFLPALGREYLTDPVAVPALWIAHQDSS